MKSFKEYLMDENAPTTATGSGIDLAPTAGGRRMFRKLDRRSRFDVEKMYKRSLGLNKVPSSSSGGGE